MSISSSRMNHDSSPPRDLSHQELAWFQRLNTAVHEGDEQLLIGVLSEGDLSHALGQRMVGAARARAKLPVVLLLLTLAVANDVEAARAKVWLARYQYITGQVQGVLDAPGSLLSQVCGSIRHAHTTPTLKLNAEKVNDQDWVDAFELALDFGAWPLAEEVLELHGAQTASLQGWGRLASTLMVRRRFWSSDVDHVQVAAIFAALSGALVQVGGASAAQALQIFQARHWVSAGRWPEAQAIYEQLKSGPHEVAAHLEQAQMFCKAAEKVQAIGVLDALLRLPLPKLRRKGSPDVANEDNTQFEIKRDFTAQAAQQAWQAFAQALLPTKIPYFLVSGTLLGYARQGGLLAHDKDIDVGITDVNQQYAMAEALQASGAFTVDLDKLTGDDCLGFSAVHTASNIAIDVFIYHPVAERWVTGVHFAFGHEQRFAFTPFELQACEFLGVASWVPADVHLNLCENYGANWEQPDPGYLSHLESPSTCDRGGEDYMITLRLEVFSALVARKPERLARVLGLHEKLEQSALKMNQELREHLRLMLDDQAAWT